MSKLVPVFIVLVALAARPVGAATATIDTTKTYQTIEGPGEIVAADNGDPTSFELFLSHDRNAFNGLCLVIVRGKSGQPGKIQLVAKSEVLKIGMVSIKTVSRGN